MLAHSTIYREYIYFRSSSYRFPAERGESAPSLRLCASVALQELCLYSVLEEFVCSMQDGLCLYSAGKVCLFHIGGEGGLCL